MLLALFISTRLVGRICFCIFKFNVSAFWFFFLVNSESDAYPAVFTIFNSKRDPGLKLSFLFHIDSRLFLFFLLLALASCRSGIISSTFPSFEILVYIFDSQWMLTHTRGIRLSPYKLAFVLLSSHVFSFCFYPWPYQPNVQTSSRENTDFANIIVQVGNEQLCLREMNWVKSYVCNLNLTLEFKKLTWK